MLETIKLVVGQLRANCYLIFNPKSKKVVIIDPGDEAEYICRIINEKNLVPVMIIATHGHFDHLMASSELKLIYEIPFLVNQKDQFLLKKAHLSADYFLKTKKSIPIQASGYLKDKQKISILESEIEVLETPGHTPGSISLYLPKENTLFVGDLVFANGSYGRTDFSYGSGRGLEKSIKKILKLPENTTVYCGHGEETIIKEIRMLNSNL